MIIHTGTEAGLGDWSRVRRTRAARDRRRRLFTDKAAKLAAQWITAGQRTRPPVIAV